MKNQEISKILYEIAEYLNMDKIPFKPQAYEKAAMSIEALGADIEDVYKKEGMKGLEEIPGVGKSIAEKIEEYLKTGKIEYYEEFRKKFPMDLAEITRIEGVGSRKAKVLYEKLGIRNIDELQKAARSGRIRKLAGMGEKTEKNILLGIKFVKRHSGRFLLGEILPQARETYEKLKELKEVERVDIVGSVRRMKETIGDVDFLIISSNPAPVMDFFVSLPGVLKVWGKGKTKASIRTKYGFDMDIRVVPEMSYGAALQYFTGSKDHNIALRKIAIEKHLKLNEYGLFRGSKMLGGKKEEDIYKGLGLEWIPPEMRENQGEIEASRRQTEGKINGLPKLIKYSDVRGDLHCHSSWAKGENSIPEIAEASMSMNYEYVGISDHTHFLRIEHGLDEKQLHEQRKEINNLNSRFKRQNLRFRILQGCEANILSDGSIDIADKTLSKLDYVIAGIHSQMHMSRGKMTERIIKAMKNPNIDIISHPTGRLINKRGEYKIDFAKILRAARETKTIMEINSSPDRLDLNGSNVRKAKEMGVKMIIDTDSHDIRHMPFIELGIAQARRGWAEKKDITNSQTIEKLKESFKQPSRS